MSRLTDAVTCASKECWHSDPDSWASKQLAAAVLALIQSDECADAIEEAPCLMCLPGSSRCDGQGAGAGKHPECAQNALIAYLTADALTKEANDG